MKKYLLLSLSIIGMMSCLPSPQPKAVHPSLPIANIHADYPQKQMDVSTLAEVVYIPLPRKLFVESHSYYNAFHGCISEDWIVTYSAEGKINRVTDPIGRYVQYTYDGNGAGSRGCGDGGYGFARLHKPDNPTSGALSQLFSLFPRNLKSKCVSRLDLIFSELVVYSLRRGSQSGLPGVRTNNTNTSIIL